MTDLGKTTEEKKESVSTESKVDELIGEMVDSHPELENVKKNTRFAKKLRVKPVRKGEKTVKILGDETDKKRFYSWDPYYILKLNIWNRSIYATDHLSRLFLSGTFEMQKKYLAKKRTLGFDLRIFIIIALAIAGGLAAVIFILKIRGGL